MRSIPKPAQDVSKLRNCSINQTITQLYTLKSLRGRPFAGIDHHIVPSCSYSTLQTTEPITHCVPPVACFVCASLQLHKNSQLPASTPTACSGRPPGRPAGGARPPSLSWLLLSALAGSCLALDMPCFLASFPAAAVDRRPDENKNEGHWFFTLDHGHKFAAPPFLPPRP